MSPIELTGITAFADVCQSGRTTMKGDFNQQTGDQGKDYGGVQMEQGQVQLDHDWNAQRGSGQCTLCKWLFVLNLMLAITWILVCQRRLPEDRPQ